MFCPMESLELRVDKCPVRCMYRTNVGACGFEQLNDDAVDVTVLATLMDKKLYRVKSLVAGAKQMIEIGLAIDRYTEYVQACVPAIHKSYRAEESPLIESEDMDVLNIEIDEGDGQPGSQAVNGREGSTGVAARLSRVFHLTDNQQQEFWSEERFSNWSKRSGSGVSLQDMRQALVSIA